MAYTGTSNNSNQGNRMNNSGAGRQVAAAASGGNGDDSKRVEALFTTGLFKPEKGQALGTVRIKSALTIPAGSYLNLYTVDEPKDQGPIYRLQVRDPAAVK